MSADLLGLDSFYQTGDHSSTATHESSKSRDQRQTLDQFLPSRSISSTIDRLSEDKDEDFGDFETFEAIDATPAPFSNISTGFELNHDDLDSRQDFAASDAKSDFVTESKIKTSTEDTWNGFQSLNLPSASPAISKTPRDHNVLFDAEDEEEQDDFGDFETASLPEDHSRHIPIIPRTRTSPMEVSLIDFDTDAMVASPTTVVPESKDTRTVESQSTKHKTTADHSIKVTRHARAKSMQQSALKPLPPAPIKAEPDEAWDNFEESIPIPAKISESQVSTQPHISEQEDRDLHNDPSAPLSLPRLLRSEPGTLSSIAPDNIPPPALLLSLFPPIFKVANTELFDSLNANANDSDIRDIILSHHTTLNYLTSLCTVISVLGYIIGGRKLRWKRDAVLSQSMRIGPASSSGKLGGMKLAGLDKAETAREAREVTEVLRQWRLQVGKLRSAISGAGLHQQIPELAETLNVRVAQANEGATTSIKACALCGVKRNERVIKIDASVQDSFGEFWVEHWGHRACMSFWHGQKDNLHGR